MCNLDILVIILVFMRNSVFCFSYSKSWINSVFFLVIQKIIRGFVLGFFCTGTCNGQAILTHHQVMLISFSVLLWSFFPKISSCNHHQQYWKYLERYRKNILPIIFLTVHKRKLFLFCHAFFPIPTKLFGQCISISISFSW